MVEGISTIVIDRGSGCHVTWTLERIHVEITTETYAVHIIQALY